MITDKNTNMITKKIHIWYKERHNYILMKLDLFNILTKIIYSIKFISYKNMIIQTYKRIIILGKKFKNKTYTICLV